MKTRYSKINWLGILLASTLLYQNCGSPFATRPLEKASEVLGSQEDENDAGDEAALPDQEEDDQPEVIGEESAKPEIIDQAGTVSIKEGDTFVLFVRVADEDGVSYVWKKGASTIQGENSATLSISKAELLDAGIYTATATNDAGSSVTFPMAVNIAPKVAKVTYTAPKIYRQPIDFRTYEGRKVTLQVDATVASGDRVNYQWFDSLGPIPGANSHIYSFIGTYATKGIYSVLITNSHGQSVVSRRVTVSLVNQSCAPIVGAKSKARVAHGKIASYVSYCSSKLGINGYPMTGTIYYRCDNGHYKAISGCGLRRIDD